MKAPAAFKAVAATYSLPAATTLNVRNEGAAGNGTTDDSNAIQGVINSNPYGTIYFPSGVYRLHNLYKPGLEFDHFHGKAIMQNGARFACDTIATPNAGSCIRFENSSNVTIDNFRVGYVNNSSLPFIRENAGNTAMLIATSQNVLVTNTTIEASPGPGIWVATSTNVRFNSTSVSNATADGLHFENAGSAFVDNYFAQNTGDDSLEWNNTSRGTVYCGLTASNIQIFRSLSSGIAVRGGCGASFSNFYIDTTANSGLIVAEDPHFGTLVPVNNTFTNGTVLSSGRIKSPVVSAKDCIDVSKSKGSTFNNIECVYPLLNGSRIDGGADTVTLSGVSVDAAANVGFAVGDATNVTFKNAVSRASAGGGYVVIGAAGGAIEGGAVCNSGRYGMYHANTRNFTESNLVLYDSSEGNSSNRAWWAESGASKITVNGLTLVDDLTRNKIVVGAVGAKGTIAVNGLSVKSSLAAGDSLQIK